MKCIGSSLRVFIFTVFISNILKYSVVTDRTSNKISIEDKDLRVFSNFESHYSAHNVDCGVNLTKIILL